MGSSRKLLYAVNNTGFQVNDKRIDGTYQKYQSIDDKTDGFFYYGFLHKIWLWKNQCLTLQWK